MELSIDNGVNYSIDGSIEQTKLSSETTVSEALASNISRYQKSINDNAVDLISDVSFDINCQVQFSSEDFRLDARGTSPPASLQVTTP